MNMRFGKQTLYLYNEYENAAVRITPSVNGIVSVYVKVGSNPEFKAQHGNTVVVDAIMDRVSITPDDYMNFGQTADKASDS